MCAAMTANISDPRGRWLECLLALLKRLTAKIPAAALTSERFGVEVMDDAVLRDPP